MNGEKHGSSNQKCIDSFLSDFGTFVRNAFRADLPRDLSKLSSHKNCDRKEMGMGDHEVKEATRYRYEKRIRELESENAKLRDDFYYARSICERIHDGCIEVLEKDSRSIKISWVIQQFKSFWRKS